MTTKFNYNDLVVVHDKRLEGRSKPMMACIVGIFEERPKQGHYFDQFPPGIVYTVEFEDGSSTEVHEDGLKLVSPEL